MKRIMIVEDEAAIREFEAINLTRAGYSVVEAREKRRSIYTITILPALI